MAAGEGDGKGIELALGNFYHRAYPLKQVPNFALPDVRGSSVESHRYEPATGAAYWTGHSSCPACGRSQVGAKFRKRDASGKTYQSQRTPGLSIFDLSNLAQQI